MSNFSFFLLISSIVCVIINLYLIHSYRIIFSLYNSAMNGSVVFDNSTNIRESELFVIETLNGVVNVCYVFSVIQWNYYFVILYFDFVRKRLYITGKIFLLLPLYTDKSLYSFVTKLFQLLRNTISSAQRLSNAHRKLTLYAIITLVLSFRTKFQIVCELYNKSNYCHNILSNAVV